jgi:hypothetical protein
LIKEGREREAKELREYSIEGRGKISWTYDEVGLNYLLLSLCVKQLMRSSHSPKKYSSSQGEGFAVLVLGLEQPGTTPTLNPLDLRVLAGNIGSEEDAELGGAPRFMEEDEGILEDRVGIIGAETDARCAGDLAGIRVVEAGVDGELCEVGGATGFRRSLSDGAEVMVADDVEGIVRLLLVDGLKREGRSLGLDSN